MLLGRRSKKKDRAGSTVDDVMAASVGVGDNEQQDSEPSDTVANDNNDYDDGQ